MGQSKKKERGEKKELDDRRKVKQEKKISDHHSQQIQRLIADSVTNMKRWGPS